MGDEANRWSKDEQEARTRQYLEKRQRQLDEQGWFIEAVSPRVNVDSLQPFKFYTYGLAENFGHPDMLIRDNFELDMGFALLRHLIEKIQDGRQFRPGHIYRDILASNDAFQFIWSREKNRHVLRILLPLVFLEI